MRKQRSIKTKVLVILLFLQIPLAVMIIVYNLYYIRFYNHQISDANRSALSSWCGVLESDLSRLDDRQLNFVTMNEDFRMLAISRTALESHLYSYNILQEYQELVENNEGVFGCYIINNSHQIFRENYGGKQESYEWKYVLRQFFREYVAEDETITQRSWQVLQMKNINQDLKRSDLAELVHLNIDYLSRVFKKEKGVTLNDYIVFEKLNVAENLLKTTRLPISLIAMKVGYSNFSYFRNSTKRSKESHRQRSGQISERRSGRF